MKRAQYGGHASRVGRELRETLFEGDNYRPENCLLVRSRGKECRKELRKKARALKSVRAKENHSKRRGILATALKEQRPKSKGNTRIRNCAKLAPVDDGKRCQRKSEGEERKTVERHLAQVKCKRPSDANDKNTKKSRKSDLEQLSAEEDRWTSDVMEEIDAFREVEKKLGEKSKLNKELRKDNFDLNLINLADDILFGIFDQNDAQDIQHPRDVESDNLNDDVRESDGISTFDDDQIEIDQTSNISEEDDEDEHDDDDDDVHDDDGLGVDHSLQSQDAVEGRYVPPHKRNQIRIPAQALTNQEAIQKLIGLANRLSEANLNPVYDGVMDVFKLRLTACASSGSDFEREKFILVQKYLNVALEVSVLSPHANVNILSAQLCMITALSVTLDGSFGSLLVGKLRDILDASFEAEKFDIDSANRRRLAVMGLGLLFEFNLLNVSAVSETVRGICARIPSAGNVSSDNLEAVLDTLLTFLKFTLFKAKKEYIDEFKKINEAVKISAAELDALKQHKGMIKLLIEELMGASNSKSLNSTTKRFEPLRLWLHRDSSRFGSVDWDGAKLSLDVQPQHKLSNVTKLKSPSPDLSSLSIPQLAEALKLRQPLQKAILAALVGSNTMDDVVERLSLVVKSRKKDTPQVVAVALHCCLKEKIFNKFYPEACHRLCVHSDPALAQNFSRAIKKGLTAQMARLHSLPRLHECANFADFFSYFVGCGLVELSILRYADIEDYLSGLQSEKSKRISAFVSNLLSSLAKKAGESSMPEIFLASQFKTLAVYKDWAALIRLMIESSDFDLKTRNLLASGLHLS